MQRDWGERARKALADFGAKAPPDHEAARRREAEQIVADPAQVANITAVRDGDSPEVRAHCEEWQQLQSLKGLRPHHPRPEMAGRMVTDQEVGAEYHAREVKIMTDLLRSRGEEYERENEGNSR